MAPGSSQETLLLVCHDTRRLIDCSSSLTALLYDISFSGEAFRPFKPSAAEREGVMTVAEISHHTNLRTSYVVSSVCGSPPPLLFFSRLVFAENSVISTCSQRGRGHVGPESSNTHHTCCSEEAMGYVTQRRVNKVPSPTAHVLHDPFVVRCSLTRCTNKCSTKLLCVVCSESPSGG